MDREGEGEGPEGKPKTTGGKRKRGGWGHKRFSFSKIAGESGERGQHYISKFIIWYKYGYFYIYVPSVNSDFYM